MPYLQHDDSKLAVHIASRNKIDEAEAKIIVAKYVREIRNKLEKGEQHEIENIGVFLMTPDKDIQFTSFVRLKVLNEYLELRDHLESQKINFYTVGSYWSGEDRWKRFVDEGIWEVGDDESIEIVNQIKPGDFLILKSTFQKGGRGYFRIKFIGIVIENRKNGYSIDHVNWTYAANNIDVSGSLARLRHRITRIDLDDFIAIVDAIDDLEGLYQTGLFERKYFGKGDVAPKLPKYTRSEAISTDHGTKDSLNFTKDIQSLAALIALKEMKPPLAIALFGKWGSGKSFFMQSLEQRIRELSKYQGFIDEDGDPPNTVDGDIFMTGIAHIKFNAWSYMDANLWAGLAHSLFEKLNQYITDNTKGETERQKVQSKINGRLEFLNADLQEKKEKVQELHKKKMQLEEERETKLLRWFKPKYNGKIKAFLTYNGMEESEVDALLPSKLRKYVEKSIGFIDYLKGNGYQVTIWLLAIVSLIWIFKTVFVPLLSDVNSLTAILKSIWTYTTLSVLPFFFVVGKFIYGYRKVLTSLLILNDEEETLKTQSTNANEQDQTKKEIQIVNKSISTIESEILKEESAHENLNDRAIENLISEIPLNEDYIKHLGIITTIRKDFETLSDLFADKDKEINPTFNEKEKKRVEELNADRKEIEEAFEGYGNRKLNRIVLYIDDLDRCTDEKVLEVLQAVHLLMAFPLFTVVVGVDERSVHNALKYSQLKRYQNIDSSIVSKTIKEIQPREYLEKIFQIPFQLPQATEQGVEQLINHLIPNPFEEESFEESEEVKTPNEIGANKKPVEYKSEVSDAFSNSYLEEEPANYSRIRTIKPEEIRITTKEKKYLQLFAPLVGSNPRTIKRYVNIFRIIKTHELGVFEEEDSGIRIAFLIALYTGIYRRVATSFLKNEPDMELNSFLSTSAEMSEGKSLEATVFRLIESMQKSEEGVRSIMNMPKKDHLKLFSFIERFSYKLNA
ncbi:MAG: hypothetical protein HWE22_10080 [Flavobacteriales bacterium]|nr:hypothetical protein [Flavobacteriales bacterium]